MKYISNSEKETFQIGAQIAANLKNIILLYGEMGAGKTAITKGICNFLGIDENKVSSPTFAIANQYSENVFHFDAYRLSKEDWVSQGFNEYAEDGNICIIEWAENLDKDLFKNYSTIKISGSGDEKRVIEVEENC